MPHVVLNWNSTNGIVRKYFQLRFRSNSSGTACLNPTAAERKDSLFSYSGCCSGPDGAVVGALCASFAARLATFFCPRPFCLSPLLFLRLHFLRKRQLRT